MSASITRDGWGQYRCSACGHRAAPSYKLCLFCGQSFPPGRTKPGPKVDSVPEHSTFAGAYKLALRLADYWRARGLTVKVEPVRIRGFAPTPDQRTSEVYGLRSNIGQVAQ